MIPHKIILNEAQSVSFISCVTTNYQPRTMNINVNIIIVNLHKQRMFHFGNSTVFTGMDLQVHEYDSVSAVIAYCQGNLKTGGSGYTRGGSGSTSEDTRRRIVITALYTGKRTSQTMNLLENMISLLLIVFNKRDVIKNAVNSDQRLSPTVSKLLKSYVIPSYIIKRLTYEHIDCRCGVESVRNLVVSVPCLTCRTARTFTTLARRGTYLTPQLRVKCFIYTSQEHKIYPCVFGKRSLLVITSLLMQSGRTASYPFSLCQFSYEISKAQGG